MTKCEGEATANNRKAKLIFFYEWVLNGDWEGIISFYSFFKSKKDQFLFSINQGTYKNSDNKTVYKGTFEVTNLSEENEPKDIDVCINLSWKPNLFNKF